MSQSAYLSKYCPGPEGIEIIDVEANQPASTPPWKAIRPDDAEHYSRRKKIRKSLSLNSVRKLGDDTDDTQQLLDDFNEYVLDRLVMNEMLQARYKELLDRDDYKDMPENQKKSILSSVGKIIHPAGSDELKRALFFDVEEAEEVVEEECSPLVR